VTSQTETQNTNDHHMPLIETDPIIIFCVPHCIYGSFVGHSFRVKGETWDLFANSPLCV